MHARGRTDYSLIHGWFFLMDGCAPHLQMDFEALLRQTAMRSVEHVVYVLRDVSKKHATWGGDYFKAKIQVVLDQAGRPEWTRVSGLYCFRHAHLLKHRFNL
jgi:hypothetical protein